jgi:hypothetical protein
MNLLFNKHTVFYEYCRDNEAEGEAKFFPEAYPKAITENNQLIDLTKENEFEKLLYSENLIPGEELELSAFIELFLAFKSYLANNSITDKKEFDSSLGFEEGLVLLLNEFEEKLGSQGLSKEESARLEKFKKLKKIIKDPEMTRHDKTLSIKFYSRYSTHPSGGGILEWHLSYDLDKQLIKHTYTTLEAY